jgi:hypothetical protein
LAGKVFAVPQDFDLFGHAERRVAVRAADLQELTLNGSVNILSRNNKNDTLQIIESTP